ncbi:MAG: phage holin family protein [Anaerolineae bacterium]
MTGFLLTWLVTTISLFIISKLKLGIDIKDLGTAAVAALVLGLLNAVVRPILAFLSFPITLLTLGLFALVLNALMIMLMAALVKGVRLRHGFWSALLGSIVLSLLNWLIFAIIR